jgi:hypothetical protein
MRRPEGEGKMKQGRVILSRAWTPGRRSAATFSRRWTKRRRYRRAPEAEPPVGLHAREKARYQAETDGAEGEGAIMVQIGRRIMADSHEFSQERPCLRQA